MTPQAEILTKTLYRLSPSGDVSPNPFYGAREDHVRARLEEAKAVYADVFKQFIAAWWAVGDRNNPPPRDLATFAV